MRENNQTIGEPDHSKTNRETISQANTELNRSGFNVLTQVCTHIFIVIQFFCAVSGKRGCSTPKQAFLHDDNLSDSSKLNTKPWKTHKTTPKTHSLIHWIDLYMPCSYATGFNRYLSPWNWFVFTRWGMIGTNYPSILNSFCEQIII